jgi:hypothetical protein
LEFPFDLKAALPRTRQSPDFPRPALADIRRYGRAFEKVSGGSKKNRGNPIRNLKDTKKLFGVMMSAGKPGARGNRSSAAGRRQHSQLLTIWPE